MSKYPTHACNDIILTASFTTNLQNLVSFSFNILGDYNGNPQESLSIILFILATPQPVRAEMQAGPIHISCDPQQHVVMLANQI